MVNLRLNEAGKKIAKDVFEEAKEAVEKIHFAMEEKTAPGGEFLGWLHYPSSIKMEEVEEIQDYGQRIKDGNKRVFCLGIGGSYLGALAAIRALGPREKTIHFYGNTFSALELEQGLDLYNPEEDHLLVISKSGTTMETAVAFRLFRDKALKKLGNKAYERITAITDKEKGALFELAKGQGIKRYIIPDDIGGRYSVLSPVGLLPMAIEGIDIVSLIEGAREEEARLQEADIFKNPAYQYGLLRQYLYKNGKNVEIFATYEPSLEQVTSWYKQLFGESEGKEGKGILPCNLLYSTDLHSMGQFVQEGPRNLFETILSVKASLSSLSLPFSEVEDGLGPYQGMAIDAMNKSAMEGTRIAHERGGVFTIEIAMDDLRPKDLGALFYFLQKACAMSAYLQGVNPFDQPGVEAYKKEMKKRLK